MTSTFTMLADHLGFTGPKVMGHEYYVDAAVNCTSYRGALSLTGTFVASDNTFTLTVADTADFGRLAIGQQYAITDSVGTTNDATVTIDGLSGSGEIGSVITFSAVAGDETGDTITLTPSEEYLLASDFGLSNISAVFVTGHEDGTNAYTVKTSDAGAYASSKYVELEIRVGSTGTELAAAASNGDCVRLRVFGNL
jgi:hypothetical protein